MRKQIISLLVAILVFVAMVPAAFAANNQQLAARLEGDSTTSSLVLLDEVCVATDSYGNSYVINPDERTWVSENTVTVCGHLSGSGSPPESCRKWHGMCRRSRRR